MGWQFNVCYILRLYYDWDVIATEYKAGPYIVYNTFPAGKKSNKARCVFRFVSFQTLAAAAAILSFYLWKREKNIISAWSIVKASATSGGQLAVIIISRDARV
jgi:hypothetical protein